MTTKLNPKQIGGVSSETIKANIETLQQGQTDISGRVDQLRTDVDGHTSKLAVIETDIQELKDRPIGGGGGTVVGGAGGIDIVQGANLIMNNFRDAEARNLGPYQQNNMFIDIFKDTTDIDILLSDPIEATNGGLCPARNSVMPVMTGATNGSITVTAGGTYNPTYTFWKAFEGSGARWTAYYGTQSTLTIDFGAQQDKVINRISFGCDNDIRYGAVTFEVLASHNGTDFVSLYTPVPNIEWLTGDIKDFIFLNATAYRYYRIRYGKSKTSEVTFISNLKLFQPTVVEPVVITTSKTSTKNIKYLLPVAESTGPVDFSYSVDDGATWNPVILSDINEVKTTPATSLRFKMKIYDGSTVQSLGYIWYDEDSFFGIGGGGSGGGDPAIGSMILNDTINLIYSNFRSAEQRDVSKYAWKNFVIDVFKDDISVDRALSSSSLRVENGQVKTGEVLLNTEPFTANTGPAAHPWVLEGLRGVSAPWRAFDKVSGTVYYSSLANGLPAGISIDFINAMTISSISMTVQTTQGPGTWSVHGSDDKVSWTVLENYTTTSAQWDASSKAGTPLNFKISTPRPFRYFKIEVAAFAGSALSIDEIYIYGLTGDITYVSNPDTASIAPTKMVLVSEHSGTVNYSISTDNGVTWKDNVAPSTFVPITGSGKDIRVKALLKDGAVISSLGYAWFDNSVDLSGGGSIDPGTADRITNLEISLMQSNFKIAAIQSASRYALKNMLIDNFNDVSGIDTAKSSAFAYKDGAIRIGDVNIALNGKGTVGAPVYFDNDPSTSFKWVNGADNKAWIEFPVAEDDIYAFEIELAPSTTAQDFRWYPQIDGVNYGTTRKSTALANERLIIREEFPSPRSIKKFLLVATVYTGAGLVSDIRLLRRAGSVSIVTTPYETVTAPKQALITSNEIVVDPAAAITYSISRDDGVTWKVAPPNKLVDISSQPEGTKLRVKIDITGDIALDTLGVSWS